MAISRGKPSTPGLRRGNDSDSGARLFVVLVAVSLVMFTMSARQGDSGPLAAVRNGFTLVTTPIRYVGAFVSAPFGGLGNIFENLTTDQETLSELRQQNEELIAKNAELAESAQSAERLQALLELQSAYSLQSTAAHIISGSTDSWSHTVTIDKGSMSGLAVGMPVTDSAGAIGQIVECGLASSTVRLITDENSGVSAMVQSSRAQGMLKGSASGALTLTLVSTTQTVEVGDIVITSGLGGIYPKGLPLGRVSSVSRPDGAVYYEIEVTALSSPENLEEVLVITSLTEDQKATSEDIADADAQESSSVASSVASSSDDADSDDASGETGSGEDE